MEKEIDSDEEIDWVFTFGSNHAYPMYYYIIHGTFRGARKEMCKKFGTKWSMQYLSKEEAGVNRYNLTELKI